MIEYKVYIKELVTMLYDFNKKIERRGTHCAKWDGMEERFCITDTQNLNSLWIADMDFPAPDCVIRSIRQRAGHAVYGYPIREEGYYESFISWEKEVHGWNISPEWLDYVPGVICAIGCAIQAFTTPGDSVLVISPSYAPFGETITSLGRHLLKTSMLFRDGRFEIDFEDMEFQAASASALLLCNPHNPTGRAFSHAEMERIAEICEKYSLTVISDEIHSDLLYNGHKHTTISSVSKWAASHSVTLMAPSKTFNIAGLVTSIYIIPDPEMKLKMDHIVKKCLHINGGNIFGLIAAQSAYAGGREWHRELMKYLQGNIDFLDSELKRRVPSVRLVYPEATYVPLIDCRDLGMNPGKLQEFMLNEVKTAMNEGSLFGRETDGFMRINIGTQRTALAEFVDALEIAVKSI